MRRGHRPDRLTAVSFVSRPLLDGEQAAQLFAQPGTAIKTLSSELLHVWDHARTSDPSRRAVGSLDLRSGAYFQWIGYPDAVLVECSGNEYLKGAAQLSADEAVRLIACGFTAPDAQSPNF